MVTSNNDSINAEDDVLLTDFINRYQKNFPICARPYERIAVELGVSEDKLLHVVRKAIEQGKLSRVGGVLKAKAIGMSSLIALKCPVDRIEEIAAYLNARLDVNHNYLRENEWNIWFVITTLNEVELQKALTEIQQATDCPVLDCRLVQEFRIDLGFNIGRSDNAFA